MNKDAYYFPHFSNARHDRKIKRLRKELGLEGYGIYFMILEVLRDQEDFSYPMGDIDLLADEFGTSEQTIDVVVKKYDLFKIDREQIFYSQNLIEYLKPYLERSKRARDAALKRWHGENSTNADANALPVQSSGNASKAKKSKEKEINVVFEDFWNAYQKKVGSKGKAEKLWVKLKDEERSIIMAGIGAYTASFDDKQYQPYPTTFLNQKHWEAESYGIVTQAGDVPGDKLRGL